MNHPLLKIIAAGHRSVAQLLLNLLVLLVLVNMIATWVADYVEGLPAPKSNPVVAKYGDDSAKHLAVHPGMTFEQVKDLLWETWNRPLEYQPWTQFREKAFEGTYVNVDPAGFRKGSSQGPWPPDSANRNIFVFGGSTTFGYGVADSETIPSRLQAELESRRSASGDGRPVRVYNLAQGFYFSSQERVQFQQLLLDDIRPDLAIFIDGLNEFWNKEGQPAHTWDLREKWNPKPAPQPSFGEVVRMSLPVTRAATRIKERMAADRAAAASFEVKPEPEPSKAPGADDAAKELASGEAVWLEKFDDGKLLETVLDRYRTNRQMIRAVGDSFGVATLFVWQPVPTHEYDLSQHVFRPENFDAHAYSHFGYARMDERKLVGSEGADEGVAGSDMLWLDDLQRGIAKPLYVDAVHYSPEMSSLIAGKIADHLSIMAR